MPFIPRNLILQYTGGSGSGGVASGCHFDTEKPVPRDHGGLESGVTINGMSACEVLEMILYPYEYPEFTSFYIDSQDIILEVGDKVVGGVRTFKWSTKNDQNIVENSIKITDKTADIILAENLSNDGSEDVDIGEDKVLTEAGTYIWEISALNTKNEIFTRNFKVNWLYRVYWGPSIADKLTEEQVKSLANSELKAGFESTYTFEAVDGEDYYYIVYPDIWGKIENAIDCDTGFGWDISDVGTVDVTNDFGVTITYRQIRTTYKQTADGCVKIS